MLIKFGTHNPEENCHRWLCTCPSHLKNVSALPCDAEHVQQIKVVISFQKLHSFENSLFFYYIEISFQIRTITENVESYYHIPVFLTLIYHIIHHAVLAFSPCFNKLLMWLALTLWCLVATGTYTRSFWKFLEQPQ